MILEIVFKDGRKENFDNVASFNVVEETSTLKVFNAYEVAKTPSDEKLFEVNPLEIDRRYFREQRKNLLQENTRQVILKAFDEFDKCPGSYYSSFYTLIPKKRWGNWKNGRELCDYANCLDLEGHMANWVEQALEWAQRISNGESWEDICSKRGNIKRSRVILGGNGIYLLVGCEGLLPASNIHDTGYLSNFRFHSAVPLVVIEKK